MKIIWVGTPSDNEFDLTAAVAKNPAVDLIWYCCLDPQDANNAFHLRQCTIAPNIYIIPFLPEETEAVCEMIADKTCDLVVLRHPMWTPEKAETVAYILEKSPTVLWTWEWIPNEMLHQLPHMAVWPRIAMTNSVDWQRCRKSYPDKQPLYLPFGAVPWTDEELIPDARYQADIVCDAQPHYLCGCADGVKRKSVDMMVTPILDLNPVLWGNRYGSFTEHDWVACEEFSPHVRGTYETREYPKVYASSKIYLGVSWNAPTGGYSIRLSRALSCGIMVFWPETKGAWADFNLDNPNKIWMSDHGPGIAWVCADDTAQEVHEMVEYYLKNPDERAIWAKRGRQWVTENWEWTKLLTRISKEIA